MYNTSVVWTSWDGVWKIKYRDRETAREKEEGKKEKKKDFILFYFFSVQPRFPLRRMYTHDLSQFVGKKISSKAKNNVNTGRGVGWEGADNVVYIMIRSA